MQKGRSYALRRLPKNAVNDGIGGSQAKFITQAQARCFHDPDDNLNRILDVIPNLGDGVGVLGVTRTTGRLGWLRLPRFQIRVKLFRLIVFVVSHRYHSIPAPCGIICWEVKIVKEGHFDMVSYAEQEQYERQIRQANADREQQIRAGDRAHRELLEKMSPSGARRSLVDYLNDGARQDAVAAMPGVSALQKMREAQELGRRTLHVEHNRSHEAFMKTARGSFHSAPSGFNFRADDPGNPFDSRFGHGEKFDPPQSAGRVQDPAGELRSGDPRAKDHWPSGELSEVDAQWLLSVARKIIEAVKSRQYAENKV